jgi:hypothetical protein
MAASIFAVVLASPARAEDGVTYEVVSNINTVANIEYSDNGVRRALYAVPLPWRTDVTMVDAFSPLAGGAEVRADWRPGAWPGKWVSARIYVGGKLICQNTLDIGNATCYGITPHIG